MYDVRIQISFLHGGRLPILFPPKGINYSLWEKLFLNDLLNPEQASSWGVTMDTWSLR